MAEIWIVNPYEPLPREGSVKLRYSHLCETLSARGHKVTWWSVDWAHDRKKTRDRGQGKRDDEVPYTVRTVSVSPYFRNISMARLRSHRAYARKFLQEGSELAGKGDAPDLILFSVPPMETGRAALELGSRYGAKVVLDVMDAWPDILVDSLAPTGPKRWLARLAAYPYERAIRSYSQHADAVCAQSKEFARFAVSKGAPVEPEVFYLGAERPPGEVGRKTYQETPKAGTVFVYVGSMGTVYDLRTVVQAFSDVQKTMQNCHLLIIGDGEQRRSLQELARSLSCDDCIQFPGYLQGADYHQALASGHVGLVPMHPSSGVAIPYKAGEYLAHGMFVINSLPGELQGMLEENGCGSQYVAGDVDSLAGAMKQAIVLVTSEGFSAICISAHALFNKKLDRARISKDFADWLEGLLR